VFAYLPLLWPGSESGWPRASACLLAELPAGACGRTRTPASLASRSWP